MNNLFFRILWSKKYILLFVVIFVTTVFQRFENKSQPNSGLANSVSSDGLGYYAYLPATIIYQDFKYEYYFKSENRIKSFYYLYPHQYTKDSFLNKYYCGVSICLLPFFLVGIVISAIAGTDINGYTDTFLMLVSIATILYYLLATFFLTRIARFFYIDEKTSFIMSVIFFLGTNLFHYVIQEPSMSHTYSFFAVTLFFYILTNVIKSATTKNIVYLSLSLALVALIRPPNVIVVLFIPFFFHSLKECAQFFTLLFTKHLAKIILATIVFCISIFIQLMFYYLQTGHFIVESYPGETFNFLNPEIFNILFSYKKGLFLYTPLILIALLFVVFSKTNLYKRMVFFITVSVFTYIAASWWCWYYGGGFSGRTFIDIYPLFIITLMVMFHKLSLVNKRVLAVIIIPFLFINQIMAYQYSHRILKGHEMTKETYITSFLRTSLLSANENFKYYLLSNKKIIKTQTDNYEMQTPNEYISQEGFNSKQAYIFGNKFPDCKNIKISLRDLNINIKQPFYIVVECDLKTQNTPNKTELIVSISNESGIIKWDFVYDTQFNVQKNGWKKMIHVVEVSNLDFTNNEIINTYLHNDKGDNLVDNLKYIILQ